MAAANEAGGVDRVAIAGAFLGVASLAFGFLQARPSRIAAGAMIPLWRAASPLELAIFLVMPVLALVASVAGTSGRYKPGGSGDHWRPLAIGAAGNLIIIISVLICATSDKALLPPGAQYARISFAPGFWIALLSGYFLIVASLRRVEGRWIRLIIGAAALLVVVMLAASGALRGLSIFQELANRRETFLAQLTYHVAISFAATLAAIVLGIPAGIWAQRHPAEGRPILLFVNAVQTIPSLALFGLLIAPLSYLSHAIPVLRAIGLSGVGSAPAFVALALYALLPIVGNTYVGLSVVDPAAKEAGKGMGMGSAQLLVRVELPLALPVIIGGTRTALVQSIGNAAVAALIGAGGFGVFIFQGLGQAAPDLILLGTLPVIALSIVTDRAMAALGRAATPKGGVSALPAPGGAQ